jgi:hypothetical protein
MQGQTARDLPEENLTQIQFPIPQNYPGVCNLLRYVCANLSYHVTIDLISESIVSFGKRELPKPITLSSVVASTSIRGLRGTIQQLEDKFESAHFSMDREFVDDLEFFTRINFETTPGYEPGELQSDSTTIMGDVKKVVLEYFKEFRRQIKIAEILEE